MKKAKTKPMTPAQKTELDTLAALPDDKQHGSITRTAGLKRRAAWCFFSPHQNAANPAP